MNDQEIISYRKELKKVLLDMGLLKEPIMTKKKVAKKPNKKFFQKLPSVIYLRAEQCQVLRYLDVTLKPEHLAIPDQKTTVGKYILQDILVLDNKTTVTHQGHG